MAYTKTNWVNGYTPLNASNMNKIEEGIFNNDTFLSSLDIRVNTLEGSIGQGGISSVVVSGNGNALNNASYDPSTKILNFEKNNTFALDSDLDSVNEKNLYHLGAYDSVSGNVITRQTGYLNSKDLTRLNWVYYNGGGYDNFYVLLSNAIPVSSGTDIPYIKSNIGNVVSITDYNNITTGIVITIDNNKNINVRPNTSDINSVETFKAWISRNNLEFQYRLDTSYTETIIEDRPLTTLDQSGSQWVRDEWEKGLNLLTGELKKDSFNNNGFYFECKQTGVYTFSIPISITYINCDYSDGSGNVGNVIDSSELVVNLKAGKSYLFMLNNGDWQGALDFLNTAMLNEGSHPYPYQQYQGGIAREDQLVQRKIFSASNSTMNDVRDFVNENYEHIISIIYYAYSEGQSMGRSVIYNADEGSYFYINSERTFSDVQLNTDAEEGSDYIYIYYNKY